MPDGGRWLKFSALTHSLTQKHEDWLVHSNVQQKCFLTFLLLCFLLPWTFRVLLYFAPCSHMGALNLPSAPPLSVYLISFNYSTVSLGIPLPLPPTSTEPPSMWLINHVYTLSYFRCNTVTSSSLGGGEELRLITVYWVVVVVVMMTMMMRCHSSLCRLLS